MLVFHLRNPQSPHLRPPRLHQATRPCHSPDNIPGETAGAFVKEYGVALNPIEADPRLLQRSERVDRPRDRKDQRYDGWGSGVEAHAPSDHAVEEPKVQ